MKYVEILAAGKGARMGNTDLPKQFLLLGDKPIVIHTIEQFILNNKIDKILILCSKQWLSYMKDLLKKHNLGNENVIVVESAGNNRNETIMDGCNFIENEYGITKDDIIITHDAVRPFINQKIINENLKTIKTCDAVDTVISATDTIVESINGKEISDIPERNKMFQGQTPQTFKLKELIGVYNSLKKDEKENLTDACKMFVLKNKTVKIVEGDSLNIKITVLNDLKISNAILSVRKDYDK